MKRLVASLFIVAAALVTPKGMWAQSIADYTAYPAFMSNVVPPIVMFVMSKDHKLFYKAYNDVTDLDEDGTIDITYTDTIDYYGYFDPRKCYTYSSTRFEPAAYASGTNKHYCSGSWSGNFLNWASMSRLDILRKVLYGGHRSTDNNTETVLGRALLPRDAHSWVKVYKGSDISSLTPFAWSNITMCNLNTAKTETKSLLYVKNAFLPYAASTEGRQCVKEEPGGSNFVPDYTYNVEVLVCKPSLLESNCEKYDDTANGGGIAYKPSGVMQKFGVNRMGNTDPGDDVVQMKFGLLMGSYGGNASGGILRSNISSINSEVSAESGNFKSSSKVIQALEQLRVTGYNYSTGWYDEGGSKTAGTVGPTACIPEEPYVLANGECTSWGNPVGEMVYETIRYFQGRTGPTSEYALGDPGFSTMPDESGKWNDPYASCPECAQPFALVISDAFPSFDSDDLPGSYWPSAISTSDTPGVQTLVSNAKMNSLESIGSTFIGESAGTFDRKCTAKSGDFTNVRGLCGEEPTKQGAFYVAGLAHYAKTTDLRALPGDQKMTTYSVMTGSPIPHLEFTVNGKNVQVVPAGHDGCPSATLFKCTAQGDDGDNSKLSLVDFQFCHSDSDWTNEQSNGFQFCYDVMWDDAEYGWDYELDARHRLYVKTDGGAGTITIKNKGIYAAAGHRNYVGYLLRGVDGAGEYLDVVCGGDADFSDCDRSDVIDSGSSSSDNSMERTFTVTGSTAGFFKDPLWYAAKYGGFKDKDGDGTPNQTTEWDEDGDGNPDSYFNASNPLQLEEKLATAILSILNRASAGSAASVLASSSTGEGALYQSFFFPSFFENGQEVKWSGATQGLFLDAFGNLREDTNGDGRLVYADDQIVRPRFDVGLNKTVIDRYDDADGDGLPDTGVPVATVNLNEMASIWEAGRVLAQKSSCDRNILTWIDIDNDQTVDAGERIQFNATCAGKSSQTAKLAPYLRPGSAPYTAENIINFVRGEQISGMRNRLLKVGGSLRVWKLGDPVHAQPIVVGAPAQRYDIIYGDTSYTDFLLKYKDRRHVAYVGANDGMLHAFNAGFFHRGDDPTTSTKVEHGWFTRTPTDNSSGPLLGEELFGFIPQELLPHLKWLTQTDYTHVYYVDLTPKVTDARIFTPDTDHPNGWGTILIGGFRLGGSCGGCASGTGAPPMTVTADFDYSALTPDETRTFYSAYFVLDITNPESPDYPKLLWSFSSADLGLTAAVPSMLRVSPSSAGITDNTDAKWFMIVGSGPTGYGGSIVQEGKLFAIDLAVGPGLANTDVKTITADTMNAFLASTVTIDANFDYRVDVTYTGGTIHDGSLPWRGKLYRLTMNECTSTPCSPDGWGIARTLTERQATEILDLFPSGGSTELGPVTASPAVTVDDSSKIWLFAGTGRLFDSIDRNDTSPQHFVGLKDSVINGTCAQSTRTSCLDDDLVNVSAAQVCLVGVGTCGGTTDQVTGVTGASNFPSLVALVASRDGWFTTLPTTGERSLSRPLVFGGLVLFPTFLPNNDPCSLNGESQLYALYYLTGSAYSSPVVGKTSSGGNEYVKRSTSLGAGMASQAVVHIGKSGGGRKMTAYIQKSSGELSSIEVGAPLPITSRFITWYDSRE